MNIFKKSLDAISVLDAESEILMYEITPHDWAVLSQKLQDLKSHFDQLEADYLEE